MSPTAEGEGAGRFPAAGAGLDPSRDGPVVTASRMISAPPTPRAEREMESPSARTSVTDALGGIVPPERVRELQNRSGEQVAALFAQ